MKICPKCGTENKNSQSVCEECYASLSSAKSIEATDSAEAFFAKEEKKERRNKILSLLPFLLYDLIYLPLGICCVIKESDFLFPLAFLFASSFIAYFLRFHTKAFFFLEHMFKVENPDEAEPSDWYYLSSGIGAYLILILGLYFVIRTYWELF